MLGWFQFRTCDKTNKAKIFTLMEDSMEFDQDIRQRGRPRKQMQPFRFGPHVYKTPLGFQYTQPRLLAYTLQSPIYGAPTNEQTTQRRERRSAAVRAVPQRKARHSSEESTPTVSSEESVILEEDPYDKLLDYDEKEGKFLVKMRNRSYLHCEWVGSADIVKASRVGAMKVKRFKRIEVDPEFIKVDRILSETYEDSERVVLVKWRKLPYELATFELVGDVEKCEGFEEALQAYRERKKMRHMRVGMDWRPNREGQTKYTTSPQYKGGNELRNYQLEGLNWLLNRWYFRQSCIMADEMGLGKTVQSVVFVNALFMEYDYTAPALVVAPLSTIGHWEREFKNWTDLRVLVYHGSIQGRGVISDYEFQVRAGNITVRLFDVLITTYEMAMAGSEHLTQFEFGVGIFDEAHRLKNPNSKAACCLRSFSIQHKVLLSGTPIQNNLNELWALFNFIDPHRFNSQAAFLNEYKMEKSEDVERLQALLKPLMLRRMKEDVETSIPMKEETIIEVELTMIQKRYYRAILEKNIEFLARDDKSNAPNLINAMMELRKCCIHPYLLNGAEDKIVSDYGKRYPDRVRNSTDGVADTGVVVGSHWFLTLDEYYKILIQSSGKLVLLDKLLDKLHGEHKVLIFSQMTKCLDLLAEYLTFRSYRYERIDGGVRGDLRQAAIDRFSAGDAFVFLLCTRAGGVGINLTAADTVVIFDSDWNPQNDLQAQARCHRIGQKNEVKIYRLVTKNSYEREMFDKAGMKLGLDRAILQKMSFDQREDTPARKEDAIQLLLRKGAYGVLMETDDASRRFCEEDIDQILERRTQIVRHSEGRNVFSKASFQMEEEVEDPDFWDNLLSQKRSEENEGRVKRQCRRLAREGMLAPADRERIKELLDETESVLNTASAETTDNTTEQNKLFALFLRLLLHGYAAVASDPQLPLLVKYCTDLVGNAKARKDYSVHMEMFQTDYDPNLFLRHAEEFLRYHEPFLLRVQIPLIFGSFQHTEDLVAERTRGWSTDDDAEIIRTVVNVGYDCQPIPGKTQEEVNQRIRKLLSAMYHRKEIKENDNMYFKALLNFGRLTDSNELNVERFLKKDASRLRSIADRICGMTRRSRRDTPEADCYERIIFFERLEALEDMPTVRRVGMPKKWDKSRDEELREHLLSEGLIGVYDKFGINEDQALRRFETIFKAANVPSRD